MTMLGQSHSTDQSCKSFLRTYASASLGADAAILKFSTLTNPPQETTDVFRQNGFFLKVLTNPVYSVQTKPELRIATVRLMSVTEIRAYNLNEIVTKQPGV